MATPVEVLGILRGAPGETRHVCWSCPDCGAGWSDDFDEALTNPYASSCGRSRHHRDGMVKNFLVSWAPEALTPKDGAG